MLNNDKKLGVLRHLDSAPRYEIERDIEVEFEDLFDSIDVIRSNARNLEHTIKVLLYGTNYEKSS